MQAASTRNPSALRTRPSARSSTIESTPPDTDKRKQSLYFPEDMLKEIQEEANRQDRSLSWVVQQAWKIARERIKAFPAVNDVAGAPDSREEKR
jgi:uncharacterized small protein (TIGR04563 family)